MRDRELTVTDLRALRPAAVGVATEVFADDGWPALVERATSWSREALELSALTVGELDGAAAYLRDAQLAVRRLSLHAPLELPAAGEHELAAILEAIMPRLSAVVVHPQILEDPAALARLGELVALENMDVQKPTGRDVAELEPYFAALPEARFCLDVAHVKSVDPTMALGHALLDAFGDRLCELHVSGIDDDCKHVPLTAGDVQLYEPILRRSRNVPWILESLPADAA